MQYQIDFSTQTSRYPTIKEICEKFNITEKRLMMIYAVNKDPISLYTIIGEGEDSYLFDFIPSDEDFVEDFITKTEEDEIIKKILNISKKCLTKKQLEIFELRYGINDGIYKTFDECGKILGVTRQYIQHTEETLIKKIRLQMNMK